MAGGGGANVAALSLLQENYASDSEGDSGYTSDDERRKRKQEFKNPHERKKKKRRKGGDDEVDDEDMLVDWPPSSSAGAEHRSSSESQMDENSAHRPLRSPSVASSQLQSNIGSIPLPSELVTKEEHEDDSSQHQGRIRSFAHERGNWASLLYIPLHLGVYGSSFTSFLSSLLNVCQDSNVMLRPNPSSDLHISLTRTIILHLHWIQPLTDDLKSRLSRISKFSLWLHGLNVYVNEERTRTFLALRVCHGRNEIDEIISEVDSCLAEYRLPPFYKDGSYHVSLAWCTGDASENLRRLLPQLENICSHYFSVETEMRTFNVDAVLFKTGNRIHSINLKQRD